ncbi:hypothetical protein [Nitrobacter sp.]|uniref:hypothetical protein n=1 Tax=Nitrobacter sp. TaxID=29420 RepID=UPI003F64FF30
MTAFHVALIILLVFTALGLACAVWASRAPREPGIGRRRRPPAGRQSHQPDPRYCRDLQRVYSREQLEAIARRPVQSGFESGAASSAGCGCPPACNPPMPSVPAGTRAAGGRHA